jgi:DNA-binding protein HU-beta
VMERVSAGERVIVTGFGTFERTSRPARTARNPRTGQPVEVPAAEVPRFRSGQTFRTRVAGNGTASGGQAVPASQAAAEPEPAVSVAVEPSRPKKPKNGGKKGKKASDAKAPDAKKKGKRAKAAASSPAKSSPVKSSPGKKKSGKAKTRAKSGK